MEIIIDIIRWLFTPVRWLVGAVMNWAGKEKQDDIEQRIQSLERQLKRLQDDPGYEILTYWDEDGTTFGRELGEALKPHIYRYPRTIFSRKTGTIQEIPFPGDKKIRGNNDS